MTLCRALKVVLVFITWNEQLDAMYRFLNLLTTRTCRDSDLFVTYCNL